MIVKIKRQKNAESPAYYQSFRYDGSKDVTVSAVLDYLNGTDRLTDIDGKPADRIRWECSCLQAVCGGCAMLINKKPSLACDSFLKDIKGDTLILEPLSKFPVVCDLVVDRSIIEKNLLEAEIYIKQYSGDKKGEHEHQYQVAKCLHCGLCLEVCPNYVKGEDFFGGIFANSAYLAHSLSKDNSSIKKEYNDHFAKGCSKSLSCQRVCPVHIQTLSSIAKMNRPEKPKKTREK